MWDRKENMLCYMFVYTVGNSSYENEKDSSAFLIVILSSSARFPHVTL